MKKTITLLAIVLVTVVILASCSKGYIYWKDEEGVEYLLVDDVQYSTKPNGGWLPLSLSVNKIGYIIEDGVSYRDEHVYRYEVDTEHMMLMKRARGIGTAETNFYRDDYDWPEFDLESIDYLGVSALDDSGYAPESFYEGIYEYENHNKEIINECLKLFTDNTGNNLPNAGQRLFRIALISEELLSRGIMGITASIEKKGNEYWFQYTKLLDGKRISVRGQEIPKELAERIVGDLM